MNESTAHPFLAFRDDFANVLGDAPRLVKVVDADAHEGPAYVRDEDALYVTTLPTPAPGTAAGVPSTAIVRVALDGDRFPVGPGRLSVVRDSANLANGMTLDRAGRLVICEQGTRSEPARISRLEPKTNEIETVVDRWAGRPLNSPNDVVVRSDGTIWFTDPSYGFLQGFRDEPRAGDHVYRYDPAVDDLSVVAAAFDKPNELAFSPDESVLYVGDSGAIHGPNDYSARRPHHVVAFDVEDGRHLVNRRLFADVGRGFPDGVKVDAAGRVFVSSADGVQVFDPAGDAIGQIRLPGAVNFAFGRAGHNILFITADTAIWAATLRTTGAIPMTTAVSTLAVAR